MKSAVTPIFVLYSVLHMVWTYIYCDVTSTISLSLFLQSPISQYIANFNGCLLLVK